MVAKSGKSKCVEEAIKEDCVAIIKVSSVIRMMAMISFKLIYRRGVLPLYPRPMVAFVQTVTPPGPLTISFSGTFSAALQREACSRDAEASWNPGNGEMRSTN